MAKAERGMSLTHGFRSPPRSAVHLKLLLSESRETGVGPGRQPETREKVTHAFTYTCITRPFLIEHLECTGDVLAPWGVTVGTVTQCLSPGSQSGWGVERGHQLFEYMGCCIVTAVS